MDLTPKVDAIAIPRDKHHGELGTDVYTVIIEGSVAAALKSGAFRFKTLGCPPTWSSICSSE